MANSAQQKINSLKSSWYIWLFPVFALVLVAWIYFAYLNENGTTIKIHFDDASSIQVDKTKVRFRGVTVGTVKKISLTDDNKDVLVDVALRKGQSDLAVAGSRFWLVLPKVGFQGVSGLETIFEGVYIAVQPGTPDGEEKKDFKGQIGSDSMEALEDTVSYSLETNSVESINVGDSITYRGMQIGSVTKVALSKTAQTVLVHLNVQDKFLKLIRTNTVFWRKVGIQAHLGLFNSEIKMNSMDSILHGGIEIATPAPAGELAKRHTKFILSAAPPKDWEKWSPEL